MPFGSVTLVKRRHVTHVLHCQSQSQVKANGLTEGKSPSRFRNVNVDRSGRHQWRLEREHNYLTAALMISSAAAEVYIEQRDDLTREIHPGVQILNEAAPH